MNLSLVKNKNKLVDWFIPDRRKINLNELYIKRGFVEAVMILFIAALIDCSMNAFGFRDSLSVFALPVCVSILFMLKWRTNYLFIGNIFVGFIYFVITYSLLDNSLGITTYFKAFIIVPLFSTFFINRTSTIFWMLLIMLSTFAFFFVEYPVTSVLHDRAYKLFFFTDILVFYTLILLLIYIYNVSKIHIDEELIQEQKGIKKQAADLITMQTELLEKNNDLKTYAHVVSHDLKSPIRGIKSFAELLETTLSKKGIDDAELNQQLSFINDNALQMEELVTDILRYSELSNDSSREFKESDLNILLEQVITTLGDISMIKNILVLKTDLPILKVLPTQTKQIFQNLISNALKFADNSRALKIEISGEVQENFVLFKIKDNGIGIRKEHLTDIFLPFKRFKSPGKFNGSGIGLANCAKVVKRHQGKIWAESIEGEGSTFSFTLSKNITMSSS